MAVQGVVARGRLSPCGSHLSAFQDLAASVLQVEEALRRTWHGRIERPPEQTAPFAAGDAAGNRQQNPVPARELPFRRGQDRRLSEALPPALDRHVVGASDSRAPRHGPAAREPEAPPHNSAGSAMRSPSPAIGCRSTSSSSSASRAAGGASISSRPSTIAPASECSSSTTAATRPRRSTSSTRCGGGYPSGYTSYQTDNGAEFQSRFHWHLEGLDIRHVYIRPRTPHLNGKVERSHDRKIQIGGPAPAWQQLLPYYVPAARVLARLLQTCADRTITHAGCSIRDQTSREVRPEFHRQAPRAPSEPSGCKLLSRGSLPARGHVSMHSARQRWRWPLVHGRRDPRRAAGDSQS